MTIADKLGAQVYVPLVLLDVGDGDNGGGGEKYVGNEMIGVDVSDGDGAREVQTRCVSCS